MPLIKVREDESLENALKRFKRKCEKSGILTEIKKRQHYEKPSVKKKRKALAARKKRCLRSTGSPGLTVRVSVRSNETSLPDFTGRTWSSMTTRPNVYWKIGRRASSKR